MRIQEIINHLDQETRDLEAKLESHPYAPTENDFIEQEQMKIYTDEYLDGMPSDYTGLLGKYGALMDVKSMLEISHREEASEEDSENFLNPNSSRFQISFDEWFHKHNPEQGNGRSEPVH